MYGSTDPLKRRRAQELFGQFTRSKRLLLSTEVIEEFYWAGSRKLGMPRLLLKDVVTKLLCLPLVSIGPTHVLDAIQIEERYRISFRDALMLAAAESGGAGVVYTEDLNDGQRYGTVLVQNPYRNSMHNAAQP
jgi:predicted nucleic acid-binding protein